VASNLRKIGLSEDQAKKWASRQLEEAEARGICRQFVWGYHSISHWFVEKDASPHRRNT